jgi:hypothetical protein
MTSGAELTPRSPARRLTTLILAATLAVTLTGCVEIAGEMDASAPALATAQARALGSPRAATAAFTLLEGAPQPVVDRFIRMLAAETKNRDITPVQPEAAKYIVHGYLHATKTAGGVTLGYVWDIFDSRRTRIQRIEDKITASGAAADPWSVADDRILGSLAAKSADDLAALLASMPEAAGNPPR